MTSEHSSKQYDMDLEMIRSKVLLMGGLVERHFHDAMLSFRSSNLEHALAVVRSDLEVNRLEVSLDDMCSHLIVKRQPAANDLRTVMATSKVITDLERIGDESTKIARITKDAIEQRRLMPEFDVYEKVHGMSRNVADMLHHALDAFARLDQVSALQLIARDEVIDEEFRKIMHDLIWRMSEQPETVALGLNTIWVAKAIERIGDHAKNIAEHTVYIVEGKDIRHTDYALNWNESGSEP